MANRPCLGLANKADIRDVERKIAALAKRVAALEAALKAAGEREQFAAIGNALQRIMRGGAR